MKWTKQEAETTFITKLGEEYPSSVIAVIYEENELGERRLVESKQFNLIPAEDSVINISGMIRGFIKAFESLPPEVKKAMEISDPKKREAEIKRLTENKRKR